MASSWTHELIRYLPNTIVVLRSDACFHEAVDIFNRAVISPAHALVRVTSASDVSTVILFAKSHGLSISVKAGGHNTAGWSIQGDIVIDLCSLNNVDLHLPDESTGRVSLGSLRNASYKGKGKKRGETEAFGTEGGRASGSSSGCMNGMNKKGLEGGRIYSFGDRCGEEMTAPDNLSRSGSTTSSNPSNGNSGSSGDVLSATTSGLSTSLSSENQQSATGKGKSRGRGDSNGLNSNGMNEQLLWEGTRNWLAEQSNQPTVPSWATSYQPRRNSLAPGSSSTSTSPSGSFPSISSNGFNLNPSTLASSSSSGGAGSTSGFVFNPAALASRSTLASSISAVAPIPSPPQASVRVPMNNDTTTTPLPSAFPLASTTTPRSAPFASYLPPSTHHLPSLISTSPTASTFNPSRSGSGSTSSTSPSSSTNLAPYALVTICAGAKSHEIDAVTGTMNYFCPQAAYPVGCAIFASGGFGFMSRLNGLSMDNVVEVEMVLADGRIVYLHEPSTASLTTLEAELSAEEIEQRDMWWAFRGAGTALGIVTRLRAKAYKLGLVFSGNVIYPFNTVTTPSLIRFWRDCCRDAPRELYCNLILTAGPDANSHVVVIQICYLGARGEGEQFLQKLMSWEGERCLLKDVETRSFLEQQDSVKQVLGVQAGSRWCIRANLMHELPDEAIRLSVLAFVNIPEKSAWLFEIAGGAIADVEPDFSCFPLSHRVARFQVAAIHQWKLPAQDNIWTHAAKDWIENVIGPHSPGGSFPCFLETREGVESVRKVFGADNWRRLVGIKKSLDPDRVFCHTFWPEELNELEE